MALQQFCNPATEAFWLFAATYKPQHALAKRCKESQTLKVLAAGAYTSFCIRSQRPQPCIHARMRKPLSTMLRQARVKEVETSRISRDSSRNTRCDPPGPGDRPGLVDLTTHTEGQEKGSSAQESFRVMKQSRPAECGGGGGVLKGTGGLFPSCSCYSSIYSRSNGLFIEVKATSTLMELMKSARACGRHFQIIATAFVL